MQVKVTNSWWLDDITFTVVFQIGEYTVLCEHWLDEECFKHLWWSDEGDNELTIKEEDFKEKCNMSFKELDEKILEEEKKRS